MIRRHGSPAIRGQRYRIRPGAYAVLVRDHRVLVTRQDAPLPEFQLPGGGIDPGEGMVQALHREVLEETGWRISFPRWFTTYRRFAYMPEYDLWAEKICHIFLARPVLRLGNPTEAGHSAHWASPDVAAEALAVDADAAIVRRLFNLGP